MQSKKRSVTLNPVDRLLIIFVLENMLEGCEYWFPILGHKILEGTLKRKPKLDSSKALGIFFFERALQLLPRIANPHKGKQKSIKLRFLGRKTKWKKFVEGHIETFAEKYALKLGQPSKEKMKEWRDRLEEFRGF